MTTYQYQAICPSFTVTTRNGTETFQSSFHCLGEASDYLESQIDRISNFARSLMFRLTQRHLSYKETAWMHKLATDLKAKVEARATTNNRSKR